MTRERSSLGEKGEEIAMLHLKQQGYRILEQNFRTKLGEIDIVAVDSGSLVFVEVKTRRGITHGSPLEAITLPNLTEESLVPPPPRCRSIRFSALRMF